ncbi:MAG: aldehyde dehydrogenase family protein [Acidimicrobiales bacterium]
MSEQAIEVGELRHLIGGEWVTGSGADASSSNPAHPSTLVATYRLADEAMLDTSITCAVEAQQAWADLGLIERGRILRNAATLLEERGEAIAALMTAEEGKTLPESSGEVGASVETLHYHAAQARSATGATFASSHPDEWIRTVRVPIGVVGVITPWNFPVQIPVWKIAPALLWGNAVQWKPASETPAVSVALAEVFHDAGVPPGVLSLLLTPGSVGAKLVADERVGAITFTGSVPVGRSIAATAVARGAKAQLELGGHNAAVVLPDICPATIAEALTFGAMGSTGQKCTATRRIIAVGSAYDGVVEAVSESVTRLRVGDGAELGVSIGPLVSAAARDEVAAAFEQAIGEGATIAASAASFDGHGHYFAPTVLTGDPSLSICHDEVFGPITTVLAAEDLDHAIELANSTSFGLTASVFGREEASIRRCVMEIDAGLVKANGPTTGSELHVPFGGLKDSTIPGPREQNAQSSADFFTSTKSAYLRTAPPEIAS